MARSTLRDHVRRTVGHDPPAVEDIHVRWRVAAAERVAIVCPMGCGRGTPCCTASEAIGVAIELAAILDGAQDRLDEARKNLMTVGNLVRLGRLPPEGVGVELWEAYREVQRLDVQLERANSPRWRPALPPGGEDSVVEHSPVPPDPDGHLRARALLRVRVSAHPLERVRLDEAIDALNLEIDRSARPAFAAAADRHTRTMSVLRTAALVYPGPQAPGRTVAGTWLVTTLLRSGVRPRRAGYLGAWACMLPASPRPEAAIDDFLGRRIDQWVRDARGAEARAAARREPRPWGFWSPADLADLVRLVSDGQSFGPSTTSGGVSPATATENAPCPRELLGDASYQPQPG